MKYELTSSSWDEKEIAAIHKVIDSAMYSMGNKVSEFEKEFAARFDAKYSVMVNSGSSANLIMVGALFFRKDNPLKPGDEVIVPAVSWSTTYAPLQQYGLHVKFVDIDAKTLNFDLEQLENAISDKTRLIFAVNLLGNPNDFAAINKMIQGKNIDLIEDNCESMGAKFAGKQAGSHGIMGSFSCYHSHHIVTMEGGAVITDDEELYHILLCLRSHGWTRHLPEENLVCTKGTDDFVEKFRFILPGFNVRPIEMMGAIGLEQLKKLPNLIQARRDNAAYFMDLLGNNEHFEFQQEIGESSWFGFAFTLKESSPLSRIEVIKKLQDHNIETRPVVAGNIAEKEMIKQYFDYSIHGTLKNAEAIDKRGFYIGNHPNEIKEKITYLSQILKNL